LAKGLFGIPTDISDVMSREICVREGLKVSDGACQPKYHVAARAFFENSGPFVQVKASHFRRKKLERIAADIHAEIMHLEPEPDG